MYNNSSITCLFFSSLSRFINCYSTPYCSSSNRGMLSNYQVMIATQDTRPSLPDTENTLPFVKGKRQVLCIWTSFWVLPAPKSWSKHFFSSVFNLFCSFQTFFNDFKAEITEKRLKMNKSWSTCKSWLTPWGGTLKWSFFTRFFTFLNVFQHVCDWFLFEMNKKGWRQLKKVFQTALGCAQHPKAGRNTQQARNQNRYREQKRHNSRWIQYTKKGQIHVTTVPLS